MTKVFAETLELRHKKQHQSLPQCPPSKSDLYFADATRFFIVCHDRAPSFLVLHLMRRHCLVGATSAADKSAVRFCSVGSCKVAVSIMRLVLPLLECRG